MDKMEQDRVRAARNMAHKLARNKSANRTVRKLSQTMLVVPQSGLKRAYPGREALHQNKRLAYILLLGVVMCAYMYDVDPDTLASMVKVVSVQAQRHLSPILGTI